MYFEGQVWRLGDNIDTDVIAPAKYFFMSNQNLSELTQYTLTAVRPELATQFQAGDIILGGKNFGCGSSREVAPRILAELGVAIIVAQSFARIFYRNCLAIGLPVATLVKPAEFVGEQDRIRVDLIKAQLQHVASGQIAPIYPTPPDMIQLLQKGGIMPLIQEIAALQ
jgi:3-isopropylmalate/(R)-2-methylmalate dehydratase small subunit